MLPAVLDAKTLPDIFSGTRGPDPKQGASACPVCACASTAARQATSWHTHALSCTPHAGGCYLYGRSYSPTVQQLGRQLAAMEDTEAAYAVASGGRVRCWVLLCAAVGAARWLSIAPP